MDRLGTKRALRRLAWAREAAPVAAAAAREGTPAADEEAPPPARPGYRVEHRRGDAVCLVGHVPDGPVHHATLAPFVPHVLNAVGGEGELVLVDEATGAVVARRRLRPERRR